MAFKSLPKHLEVAARTGVLTAVAKDVQQYTQVATEIDLTAASQTLVDLGGLPIVTSDPLAVDTFVERQKTVTPTDWYVQTKISGNDLDDDQTGTLRNRFQNILPAFQKHINSRVFTVLNAGDGTTYGTSVDGQAMFYASHVYTGAQYTTAQDNVDALTLSHANFETGWVKASQYRDDQGNYYEHNYNLLIVHPTNFSIASNIAGNSATYDTANNESNVFASMGIRVIRAPQMDTTAWILAAVSEAAKPMFVAIRKRPQLMDIVFDKDTDNGGTWYFKYHGRYVVDYADWSLAYMGNT